MDQAEVEEMLIQESLIVADDPRHRLGERRYHALGRAAGGRPLQATFTVRRGGTLLRVISGPRHEPEGAEDP